MYNLSSTRTSANTGLRPKPIRMTRREDRQLRANSHLVCPKQSTRRSFFDYCSGGPYRGRVYHQISSSMCIVWPPISWTSSTSRLTCYNPLSLSAESSLRSSLILLLCDSIFPVSMRTSNDKVTRVHAAHVQRATTLPDLIGAILTADR